jgi:[NiFe] hydrogenase diaphorase moiety large subunit
VTQTTIDFARIDAILDEHRRDPKELVQVLRKVQTIHGFIPPSVNTHISRALKLPPAQVHGVVEFYHFLSSSYEGQYRVWIADNITDRMLGNEHILTRLCERLLVRRGQTREDGRVSIDYTSCTGMCDQGPAAFVAGRPITRLTPRRADEMARLIEKKVPVTDWPKDWFRVDDNIQRRDLTLNTAVEAGAALRVALQRGGDAILKELQTSGLRGRGGAGFVAATKWRFCRDAPWNPKYVTCNADEGEPGTFKDRVLLTSYADLVIEGMTLCGLVVGAQQGFIYLRGEYEYLFQHLQDVLQRRRAAGLLGPDIEGSGKAFDVTVHLGAGAYVCGEETALVESLEGKRGIPRIRPPFLATHGYQRYPTVNSNVETFAQATQIAVQGGAWFAAAGTEKSKGTKLLSVSGDVAKPGIYEYPWGVSVQQVCDDAGAKGEILAVQVGGPSGTLIGAQELTRLVAYEDLPTGGSFMVFNTTRDILAIVHNFARFFARESCGFCTPCRVGTQVLRRTVDKLVAGHGTEYDLMEIEEIGRLVKGMSHCGLGQTAANHLLDSLKRFRDRYEARLASREFVPGFDLDGALAEARALTGRDDMGAHLAR